MSRPVAWFVHLAALAVGGTGLVYAWMRWLCAPADEFALVNHPLEPATRAWHVVLAPLLVFALGLIWASHVAPRLGAGRAARRRSGLLLVALAAPMTLSGYLLQTAVDEGWRTIWVWTHATTGIAWVAGYAVHQFARGRRRRSGPG